jgi:hypothetical protein
MTAPPESNLERDLTLGETLQEKADRLRKKAEAKRPQIEERAKALHKKFSSPEMREHFEKVKDRLGEKVRRIEARGDTSSFDATDFLDTEERRIAYLEAATEEPFDTEAERDAFLVDARKVVERARRRWS